MNARADPLSGTDSGGGNSPQASSPPPERNSLPNHERAHRAEIAEAVRQRVRLEDGAVWWIKRNRPVKFHLDKGGYQRFSILIDRRLLHFSIARVIWLLHYGSWPTNEIDHINRVRTDNRIANLRDATASENARNKPRVPRAAAQRTSVPRPYGVGVRFRARRGHWEARISINCKRIHLGTFKTSEEAVAAYRAAWERQYSPVQADVSEHPRVVTA